MILHCGHKAASRGLSLQGSTSAWTVVEIVFAFFAIILLTGVTLPAFFKTRPQRQTKICIRQLDEIDGASRRYAIEQGAFPSSMEDLAPNFLSRLPTCPAGGVYALGTPEGDPPVCSVHSIQPFTGVSP